MSQVFPQKVAVIGLGYVGLPLAAAFSEHIPTVGFDVDERRVVELCQGHDRTGAVSADTLRNGSLSITSEEAQLRAADFIVVAVPTPVDMAKQPDLTALKRASEIAGRAIKAACPVGKSADRTTELGRRSGPLPTVVYESTVFPGCTEDVCIPILESASGCKWLDDFNVGYSPERINPGDDGHTLTTIVKIVAGDSPGTLDYIARTYGLVVEAGVYRAPDIKTAEAAKVIENVQRDLNIGLMNELAILFHRIGVSTDAVLKAAATKWNFVRFEPGLVGGHCIPVDPYYLTHKAQLLGHHPEVILAGRRINDSMPEFVAGQTLQQMVLAGQSPANARVLVLGLTFKENVADVRNSGAVSLSRILAAYGTHVQVFDPFVPEAEVRKLELIPAPSPFGSKPGAYGVVVLAVPHRQFLEKPVERYADLLCVTAGQRAVMIDIKRRLGGPDSFGDGVLYWSLL
jgi:UDP-N-acetyl-D-galactosamine dehydrogenase